MSIIKSITLAFFLLLLSYCAQTDSSELIPPLTNYTILNDRPQSHSETSKYLKLKLIPISVEVADRIGGASHKNEFFVADSTLFFVDRMLGMVGAISFSGQLRWVRKVTTDDYQSFSSIAYAELDSRSSRIIIYDPNRQSFFYYDFEGRFMQREKLEVYFSDRIPLENEHWLYDLSGDPASGLRDVETSALLVRKKGSAITTVKQRSSIAMAESDYEDYENFFQFVDTTYYQFSFSDTIFRVVPPPVEPAYLIHFSQADRAQEIIDDPAVRQHYMKIFQEGVPHVHRSIRHNGMVFAIYEYGPLRRFAIVDSTGNNLVNSDRIVIDGTVLPTPWNYWNGHFFTALTDYTFDHLQQLPEYDFQPPQSVVDSFRQVEQERGYRAGGVIAVLSLR